MKPWRPNISPYRVNPRITVKPLRFSPPTVLFFGFLLLIAGGALLLKLPIMRSAPLSWHEAVFTATSAVTVTGLNVVAVDTHFTVWGELVLMLLMQTGGLGFMTFAVVALLTLGAQLESASGRVAQVAFDETRLDQIAHTARHVLIYAIVIEVIGVLLLWCAWLPEMGALQALRHACFYSVSAFNNAGFGLTAAGLEPFATNGLIVAIIAALFVLGGIGFTVLIELKREQRWRHLSVNTRLVLTSTLVLTALGTLLIFLGENSNAATLAAQPLGTRWLSAWFQSVTARTAGFNTIPIADISDTSTLTLMLLMFIGGGSVSTAGGIKVGTFVILCMATLAFLRRRSEVVIMRRRVAGEVVMKALALGMLSIFFVFFGTLALSITEQQPLLDLAFETVSALGTVGLSRGVTASLSVPGELVVCLLMLIGRLGPLTFAYLLATPKVSHVRYAQAPIHIG